MKAGFGQPCTSPSPSTGLKTGCLIGAALSRRLPPCLVSLPLSCRGENGKEPGSGLQEALPAGGRMLGPATGYQLLENPLGKLGSTSGKGSTGRPVPAAKPFVQSLLPFINKRDCSLCAALQLLGGEGTSSPVSQAAGRKVACGGRKQHVAPLQPLLPTGKSAKAQAPPPAPLLQRVTCTPCPCPAGRHWELSEAGLCQARAHGQDTHTSLREQFILTRQKKCCLPHRKGAAQHVWSQRHRPQPRVFHAWLLLSLSDKGLSSSPELLCSSACWC